MGRSMEASDAHQQVATASFPPQEVSSSCRKIQQQRAKPLPEQALKCPRCQSTNTKFCYYNNYSLSQPRYFCKGCRRYWTKGGSLRNVPVGGGYRKNKKPPSSSYSNSKRTSSLPLPFITNSNPPPPPPPPPFFPYDPIDLNLATISLHRQQQQDYEENFLLGNTNPDLSCNQGFLDIFRSGFLDDNIFGWYDEEGPLVLPSTPTTATSVTTSPQMESCKDCDREEDKMSMADLQRQQDDNNGGDCNLASDSADSSTSDQYWPTNGVSSDWHAPSFSSTNNNNRKI